MKKFTTILWGIVFILLGLILGLNALDITHIDIFFKGWWTLLIIVPCFIDLFNDHDKTGDLIGILVGLVLLIGIRGIIDFSVIWKLIVPAIFLVIGVSLIFKDTINRGVNNKIKELDNKEADEYSATFSEQNIDMKNDEFKGATLNAVFGSVKFDFSNTKILKDQVINASGIFGKVTILAPSNVNIKVKSTPIFGGVNNKVARDFNEENKTIYINAFSLFGGVDIK